MQFHTLKGTNIGPLKGIDGLLFVAHHKDCAFNVARAFARGELLGQKLDHFPLRGAGVLGLINQNMIYTAI